VSNWQFRKLNARKSGYHHDVSYVFNKINGFDFGKEYEGVYTPQLLQKYTSTRTFNELDNQRHD